MDRRHLGARRHRKVGEFRVGRRAARVPRGVYLKDFQRQLGTGKAPAGWTFDKADWWVEEYGRIMEKPDFPMPPGKYVVTGDREVTTVLTVDDAGGWSLAKGSLYDVTHLPCRAARYSGGTPADAKLADFPVTPGAEMPPIQGCASKQDYAVLFVCLLYTSPSPRDRG